MTQTKLLQTHRGIENHVNVVAGYLALDQVRLNVNIIPVEM